MKRVKYYVTVDPNQNVAEEGILKINFDKVFEDWKPLNMHFGCQGQLYYEINGKRYVDRDPFGENSKSVDLP